MRRSRFLLPLTLAALLAAATGAFLTGCGSSNEESSTTQPAEPPAKTSAAPPGAIAESCGNTTVAGTSELRVTGVGCPVGRGIVASWANNDACTANVSRPACTVYNGYRCIAARTDAGLAVGCSRPGRSISFIAKRA